MADAARLDKLRQFLERNPDDAFALYGVAMEEKRLGRVEDALATWRRLIERHPDYAAAHYQMGLALGGLGRTDEARAILRQGIEAGRRGGYGHIDEIAQALDDLD